VHRAAAVLLELQLFRTPSRCPVCVIEAQHGINLYVFLGKCDLSHIVPGVLFVKRDQQVQDYAAIQWVYTTLYHTVVGVRRQNLDSERSIHSCDDTSFSSCSSGAVLCFKKLSKSNPLVLISARPLALMSSRALSLAFSRDHVQSLLRFFISPLTLVAMAALIVSSATRSVLSIGRFVTKFCWQAVICHALGENCHNTGAHRNHT